VFGEKSIFNLKSSLKYSVLIGLLLSISVAGAANADSLFKRAQFFEKINEDSANFYYNLILKQQSFKTASPEIYGKSLRKKALIQADKIGDAENIDLCKQAITYFQITNNKKEIGITHNTMANIYQVKGYFDLAIANYQKAAAIFDSIQFYNGLTICYSNIASIYSNTEQYKNSLKYNLLAYQTAVLKNDTFSEGMIAHDVSIAFTKNNLSDSAKTFAALALKYGNSIKDDFVISYAYKAFYEYYKSKNDWPNAAINAQQSLNYILQTSSKYDACFAYCNLAESALALKKNSEALVAIEKAEKYAKEVTSFQLNKRVYALYKEITAAAGDFKSAFYYAQLYQQNSDSVFFEKRNNTLNELETKYQTAQKETKIAQQKVEIQQSKTRFLVVTALMFIIVAGSLFLYLFLKQRQKLLQNKIITIEQQKKLELTQAIIDGEEQERTRLAKELHDGIGGLMSMLKLQFTNFKKSHTAIQENAEYNTALDLLNTASQDIRKISHALMPSALERLGLIDAVEQFCTSMQASAGFEIDFQHYNISERLPQRFELLVYRIVQELLNNIVKYADAKEVIIQLVKNENQFSIAIEDDGKGFDVSVIKNKDGIGLQSMQKRIELLGGKMDIDSAIGKGTSVNIELPIS
jgi:two-component system NarL family sensor kinase